MLVRRLAMAHLANPLSTQTRPKSSTTGQYHPMVVHVLAKLNQIVVTALRKTWDLAILIGICPQKCSYFPTDY
jgi:hypothetical protein